MITLDHIGFTVADYTRSKAFYEKALAPLGMTLLMEFSGAAAGFGRDDGGRPSFFIEAHGEPVRGRLHIALQAANRRRPGRSPRSLPAERSKKGTDAFIYLLLQDCLSSVLKSAQAAETIKPHHGRGQGRSG